MSGYFRPQSPLTPTVGVVLVFGSLAVLSIVAIVLAAITLTPEDSEAAPGGTRSTIRISDEIDAVFIGDSYTQGVGASGPESRWVTLVARMEGWEPHNLGRSGTGYLAAGAPSECGHLKCLNYVETIPLVVAAKPDFVFVSGGQSDFETFLKDPRSVIRAIDTTYTSLRAGLPDTPIYAIGPSTTETATKQNLEFDNAVRSAAARVGATYVSLLQPNVIKPTFIAADRAYVNDAGFAAIAARVEESIKK
ncbi:MAG: SGNH/GDSL hydrolase family protein [Candidatus Saccharibacteria bacterium]|nr:SGNH/GDSL hydrolase family protein [Microbacteriaceae bacterium]